MIVRNMSFTEGQTLTIVGVPNSSAKQFAVNICPNKDDIALRINPRFTVPNYKKTVVFNSRQGDSWGQEINIPNSPFIEGKEFEIFIKFNHNGFVVQLPNSQQVELKNALKKDNYSIITFDGDVRIQSIEINQ
ncbi:beta-galactoside-binding lectin-like [Parambassis ranga]|uniref:Galectin n=1 Tax=Parambassis ranga TaxID=210632 RepID=A0A6P7JWC9_9TELE|nr:beta-galactoside-binding lectin-like [Parambassis ranga]